MKRKRNIYWDPKSMGLKLGKKPQRGRKRRTPTEKKARKQFTQFKSEAQREAKARKLVESDRELWAELYGKQNPARVFPGNLMDGERAALQKLVKRSVMATKKRRKRKKKNGKMPAGLAAYWRKKRAKKAKRKNPKKRPRAKVRRPRRRKPARVRNYRRRPAHKPRKRNPPRRRRTRTLHPPRGMSAQRYAKILRKAGVRVRVGKR